MPPGLEGARRVDPRQIHQQRPQGTSLIGAAPVNPPPAMSPGLATAVGLNQGARGTLPIAGGIIGGVLAAPGVVTTPLGVGLGAAIGESLGRVYDAYVDVPTVDELPPELRPWGVAGEVLGGSIVPGAAPLATAGTTGLRWIDRILTTARSSPKAYTVAEGAAAAGAAVGTGLASELSGGRPSAELAGGLVGGVASPASHTLTLSRLATDSIERVRQYATTAGRESRAAQELLALLEEMGEDIPALIKRLRDTSIPGDRRTAAQLTGSRALQLLEAELSRRNGKFGREAAQRGADSLEVMRKLIERLAAAGDPAALREAAQLRDRYFQGLISGRLQAAEREAAEAAAKITMDTPATRAELSRRAEEILSGALDNVRATERQLWSRIPGSTQVAPKGLMAEAARIAAEDLLPNEKLPGLAAGFVERAKHGTNAREMLLFRSRMLSEARNGNLAPHERRIYGQLAEAALTDLEGIPGAEEARAFSRTLNDTFSRTFAGGALATSKTGAERIPPEVLMRRATAGPAELVDLRMQELERAVRLGSPEAADEMLQIQERFLRLAASDIVDPNTGVASAPRLNRFMRFNEALLKRFPEVKEVLQSVNSANQWLKAVRESAKQAQTQITREAAFAKVAQAENPVRAISKIIAGNSPQSDFRQLATLARNSGDSAVLGMRAAVLQDAFERAGGSNGQFSFTSFRNSLLEPPRPGQPSAMQLMRANGVMDADTASRLTRLLDEADKVEAALRTRPQLETLLSNESMLFETVASMAGSRVASAASSLTGSAGGHSIIIAGRGASFMRDKLAKLQGRAQDVLIAAAENPGFMATLLEKPRSSQDGIRLARKMNAWLIGLGLTAEPEEPQQ